jgi:hypothetical protein
VKRSDKFFKFVQRLRWKINVVCMLLSLFVSFQSRFVTCIITFPHISSCFNISRSKGNHIDS